MPGMTADGQHFLEFRHCSLEDAGQYTLLAVNDLGKTDAVVSLNVKREDSK